MFRSLYFVEFFEKFIFYKFINSFDFGQTVLKNEDNNELNVNNVINIYIYIRIFVRR